MFESLKAHSFLGNSAFDYLLAVGWLVGGITVVWIVKAIVLHNARKLAERTATTWDDALINLIDRFVVPALYFGVFYLAATSVELGASAEKALRMVVAAAITVFGVRFILQAIRFAIFDVWIPKAPARQDLDTQFRGLLPAISVLVWALGIVFLLSNLGFNISALVAGLGIGGVAVALAASTILGDLFAYFAIMFDKPFVLGDFLIVDDFLGNVEHIGVKTTRLRSLGGEQLIFSNKDLTDSRIKNYKRMERRRVLFRLGVTYDTPLEKMKKLPEIVKSIIEKTPDTAFDRSHFSSFGDFNLVIEVVYYVLSSDYNRYMDIQQAINFAIKEEFEKIGAEFAFPTQTLHLVKAGANAP